MANERNPKKRQALGRGLSALIPQAASSNGAGEAGEGGGGPVQTLPVDLVDASSYQPRLHFDARSLDELAASIRRYGILQPLVVKPTAAGRYELVAGERRLRAAKLAGLTHVPVVIRDVGHDEQLELGLIENVQRADLNPIEEGRGYLQLMETFDLSQEQVAERIGKSRAYVANKVRLLNLPEEVQLLLVDGRLSEGHARALLAIPDPNELVLAAAEVAEGRLSVRDTEALARRRSAGGKAKRRAQLDADWAALVRDLEAALGTTVKLNRSRKGGALTIRFFSDEQLDGIIRRLMVRASRT